VHDVDCFAFGHRHVNIHKAMTVDILHQLLKGILMHVLGWLQALIEEKLLTSGSRRFRAAGMRLDLAAALTKEQVTAKAKVQAVIDHAFAAVPSYSKVRVFKHLSSRTQWTGREQKSMLRQVLLVFTPILHEIVEPDAIRFLRAVVDFILLALYKSYDDNTLQYMTLALFRMNQFKEVFRRFCLKKVLANKCEDVGHFNFPKWHAMVHYVDMIKLFSNAPDLETGHFEHGHVKWVKRAFKLTNKKAGWEDQVIEYGHQRLCRLTRFDPGFRTRPLTSAEQREAIEKFNKPIRAVDLPLFFSWPCKSYRGKEIKYDYWRTIEEVEHLIGGPKGVHFRQAVAVFVRKSRS